MSDISPSKVQETVTAGTQFNTGAPDTRLNIKGFRASADGLVEWGDAEGNTHQAEFIKGEVPPIAGRIAITASTAIDLLIFL